MNTEIEILKQIYMKPGIYVRSISRELKIGIPSVKYGLRKLLEKKLIYSEKEGRNLKFWVNFRSRYVVPYLYAVEYDRLVKLPRNIQDAVFHFLEYFMSGPPMITVVFGSYASGDYNKGSDLDIFMVFEKSDKGRVERVSKIISGSHGINVEPVSMTWEDFQRQFSSSDFMKSVRMNKIIVSGIEWWVMRERKGTWKEIE